MKWLRQLFCMHAWVSIDGHRSYYRPDYEDAACVKCGKLSMRGKLMERRVEMMKTIRAAETRAAEPGRLSLLQEGARRE